MANSIYELDISSAITSKDSGGTKAWTLQNLATGGRQSDHHDLGSGGTARAYLIAYEMQVQWVATPTVGNLARLYFKYSQDASVWDNDDGTGDIAVSAEDKLRNLTYVDAVQCDEAAANIVTVKRGVIWVPYRYVAPVIWNASTANFRNTANTSFLTMQLRAKQVQ